MLTSLKNACATEMADMTIESEQILNRVYLAYSKCKRFSCRASLNRIIQTDITISTEFKMLLTYACPKQLFIEWWVESRPADRRIIISSGEHVIRHSPKEFKWESEASIEDALAGEAGISSALALHIPSLLVGYSAYALFERTEKVVRLNSGADELWQISGVSRNSINRTVTARSSDAAILSINEKYFIPNGTVECASHYKDIEMSQP
jgi:hypothetical protein